LKKNNNLEKTSDESIITKIEFSSANQTNENTQDLPEEGTNKDQATKDALSSEIEKKKKRAERFGTSLKISEEEKLAQRKERFGEVDSDAADLSVARSKRLGLPLGKRKGPKPKRRSKNVQVHFPKKKRMKVQKGWDSLKKMLKKSSALSVLE